MQYKGETPLKIFVSKSKRQGPLKHIIQHQGLKAYEIYSNGNPLIFGTRSHDFMFSDDSSYEAYGPVLTKYT